MLPNGQVEDVNGTTRTTTRGIIQLIPLKPENFQFDSAELYIRDQSLEGGWRLLPSDNSLLGLQGQTPDDVGTNPGVTNVPSYLTWGAPDNVAFIDTRCGLGWCVFETIGLVESFV